LLSVFKQKGQREGSGFKENTFGTFARRVKSGGMSFARFSTTISAGRSFERNIPGALFSRLNESPSAAFSIGGYQVRGNSQTVMPILRIDFGDHRSAVVPNLVE
jgi:hypothetical protein